MILTICNPTYTLPQLIFNESTLGQVAHASILQHLLPLLVIEQIAKRWECPNHPVKWT